MWRLAFKGVKRTWPSATSSHYFHRVVIWMQSIALCCSMYACVVRGVRCVISNKAVMDCGVQPFWGRWTESKYCTACSETLSLSFFTPLSISHTTLFFFQSHTAWRKEESSKTVIYLHLIPSFLLPLSSLCYQSRTQTHPQSHCRKHTHMQRSRAFLCCKSGSKREAVSSHTWLIRSS